MTIDNKEVAETNSIKEDGNFRGISGLMEELSHFLELTPDDILGKIEAICREGLLEDSEELKETMLYSILFTLETYFVLHPPNKKDIGPEKMEFFF